MKNPLNRIETVHTLTRRAYEQLRYIDTFLYTNEFKVNGEYIMDSSDIHEKLLQLKDTIDAALILTGAGREELLKELDALSPSVFTYTKEEINEK